LLGYSPALGPLALDRAARSPYSSAWFFLFVILDRLSLQAIHLNNWSEIPRPPLTALVAARPTYGYRRITAILNRKLRTEGSAPVNHKRVYRIMQGQNLLLARQYAERSDRAHNGKVVTLRSNLRWCSDGFVLLGD
jgi:hypothetical protein